MAAFVTVRDPSVDFKGTLDIAPPSPRCPDERLPAWQSRRRRRLVPVSSLLSLSERTFRATRSALFIERLRETGPART